MSNPSTRLITLIMLLQRRPNQKAADLAENLGISVRTLHRYFTMLEEMGIPIYTERGPQGGFSLVRGYKMPPLILTPEEAAAVYLGTIHVEEIWGSLYQEAARAAMAKLDNLLPDDQRQEIAWARRSLIATGMQRSNLEALSPTLEKLRKAVREHRRIQMIYRSTSYPEPQEREVDPYALVHRWGWWYVIGDCQLRHAPRSFRVDRIQALSLSSHFFPFPEDFDIHAFLNAEFRKQTHLVVKMRFAPQSAWIALVNRSIWETLEEQPDGAVIVSMLSPDLAWAASSALAYGPSITVLEPPELIERMREWLHAINALYTEEKNKKGG